MHLTVVVLQGLTLKLNNFQAQKALTQLQKIGAKPELVTRDLQAQLDQTYSRLYNRAARVSREVHHDSGGFNNDTQQYSGDAELSDDITDPLSIYNSSDFNRFVLQGTTTSIHVERSN